MSTRILADTSLSPAEKDDREVERLINKKPPPSRKRTERRGPKRDNRRNIMKDTSEESSSDKKDLSRATHAALLNIARRIAKPITFDEMDAPKEQEGPHKPPPLPHDRVKQGKELTQQFYEELKKYSKALADSFKS